MARPTTITKEEILRVARELFLERGPTVPTAEIARQLGISEGSIFKRFPTKHELFLAAMGLQSIESWGQDLERQVGQGEVREHLVQLSVRLLGFARELLPRMMLVWSCRTDHETHMKELHTEDSPPRRGIAALARYLKGEMSLGRLRQGDPELVARIFLGSIWNLVFMETIGQVKQPPDPEGFAHQLVDTLWAGLAPAGKTR
jgi:AcrR family transcriptional regulator